MGRQPERYGVLTRDQKARLASRYYGYALHCISVHLCRRMRMDADVVTLIAHDALMTALRMYDRRIPFRPWLAQQCRYAVLTHVRSHDFASRKTRMERTVQLSRHVEAAHCWGQDSSLDRLDQAERVAAILAPLSPEEQAVAEAVANGDCYRVVATRFNRHKSFTSLVLMRCRGKVARGED